MILDNMQMKKDRINLKIADLYDECEKLTKDLNSVKSDGLYNIAFHQLQMKQVKIKRLKNELEDLIMKEEIEDLREEWLCRLIHWVRHVATTAGIVEHKFIETKSTWHLMVKKLYTIIKAVGILGIQSGILVNIDMTSWVKLSLKTKSV